MRFGERFISPEKLRVCGDSCARSVANKTISGYCWGGGGTGTLATLGQVSKCSAQPEQRQTTARYANSATVRRCDRKPGFIRPPVCGMLSPSAASTESYLIVVEASGLKDAT